MTDAGASSLPVEPAFPELGSAELGPTTRADFARNSLASVLRTSSGAFLALLLPAVIIRLIGADSYGVWAVGVEISTYLGLLDLGALSAVGHFVAGVHPPGDRVGHGQVVSTMLVIQAAMIVLGATLLTVLVLTLPSVYSGMPRSLVPSGRWAVALLGGSSLLGLLATTLSGYFLSIHRVIRPASITFASRLVGALVVVLLARGGVGIAGLAVGWAVATVCGHALIALAYGQLGVPVRRSLVSWPLARRMAGFCGAYGIWIVAGLMAIALDTVIIARIDFSFVAPYAAAVGVVSVMVGVYSSALGPLVPLAAELAVTGEKERLSALLLRSVRCGGAAVVAASSLLALVAHPLLAAWVGTATAARGERLLQVLLAANAVRLVMMPYPVMLFGTGEHRRIRSTPVIEGVVNVAVSVWLGYSLGPIGVALGTLVGAVVGMLAHVFVNLPRTRSVDLRPWGVLRRGVAGPVAVSVPAVVVLLAGSRLTGAATAVASTGAAVLTLTLMWNVALHRGDRREVRAWLRRRVGSRVRR